MQCSMFYKLMLLTYKPTYKTSSLTVFSSVMFARNTLVFSFSKNIHTKTMPHVIKKLIPDTE